MALLVLVGCCIPLIGNSEVVYFLGSKRQFFNQDIKIVTVAPSITEILYALGLGDNIIGVTRYDDFPEEVKRKEVVGGYLDIDIEKILRMKPDLVACEPNSGIKDSIELISSKGIGVVVVDIKNVMDILIAIERLGEIFNKSGEARELLTDITYSYLSVQKYIKSNYIYSGLIILNENPLMVAGNSSFVGEILGLVGIRNAYDGKQKYPILDKELFNSMKPDIVFNISEIVMSGNLSNSKYIIEKRNYFLKRDLLVYNLVDSTFVRPSYRFIEAIQKLCSLTTGYYCFY